MRKITFVLLLIVALGATSVYAKTYTLQECIDLAKQTDPDLVRFRNAVKTAGASVWNQAGMFLPSASFSLSYNKADYSESASQIDLGGFIVDTIQPATTFRNYSSGFSVGWTLFDGFQNVWNFLGSKASKRGAEYNLISTESNLVYVVKGSYYLVLKSKRDFEVAEETVARSEELLKLFEEKYDLGSASLSEVLKQKVQVGNDKLTLVRAANNYKLSKYQLAITMGINPQEDLDVEDLALKKQTIPPVEEYIKEATVSHPSLMSAKADLSASKYDVRSAWGRYLPRLSLSFSYSWRKDTFEDIVKFGSYDRTASTYITFSYNIFDGFTRERNMSRAKATLNNAKANSFYTKNKVIKDIQDAYMGIKLAEETLTVTEETERAASEDFDLVQTKYNLGAAALWELMDAQVSLKSAQFNKVKAEFDYNLALAKLYNAMGK